MIILVVYSVPYLMHERCLHRAILIYHTLRFDILAKRSVRQIVAEGRQRAHLEATRRIGPLRCSGDPKDYDSETILVF